MKHKRMGKVNFQIFQLTSQHQLLKSFRTRQFTCKSKTRVRENRLVDKREQIIQWLKLLTNITCTLPRVSKAGATIQCWIAVKKKKKYVYIGWLCTLVDWLLFASIENFSFIWDSAIDDEEPLYRPIYIEKSPIDGKGPLYRPTCIHIEKSPIDDEGLNYWPIHMEKLPIDLLVCLFVLSRTSNFSAIWRLSLLPVTGLQI
jgi:hypothetical protein